MMPLMDGLTIRAAKIEPAGPHYRQQRSDRLDRRRRPRPTRRQNSSDQTLRRKDAAENSGAGASQGAFASQITSAVLSRAA